MPDFFTKPEDIARAGYSQPVSDIAFPECGDRNVMLVSERGGLRNLGLAAENAFATPHEARSLRYEINRANASWQPAGRYDVGFYDRSNEGQPYLRANCAGGGAFGYGYTHDFRTIDQGKPDQTVWISGDVLCSPLGPCFNPASGRLEDGSHVHGIQGTPDRAFDEVLPAGAVRAYPADGPPYPPKGPMQSWMIDTDINLGVDDQIIMESLVRNDATRIGDIVIYEICAPTAAAVAPAPAPSTPASEPAPVTPASSNGPDLVIEKGQSQAYCVLGGTCIFDLWLTNRGPGTWNGIPRITDVLPEGLTAVAASPPWACEQNGTEVNCQFSPVSLDPNATLTLSLTVQIPPDVTVGLQNCARIDPPSDDPPDADADPDPSNNSFCIPITTAPPPSDPPDTPTYTPADSPPDTPTLPPDIVVVKAQTQTNCDPGGVCTFDMWMINRGPGDYTGSPRLIDTMPPGATAVNASAPWTCAPNGAEVACEYPPVNLKPNDFLQLTVTLQLPPGLPPGSPNCVRIEPAAGDPPDADPSNDSVCIPVNIAPPAPPPPVTLVSLPTPAPPSHPLPPPSYDPPPIHISQPPIVAATVDLRAAALPGAAAGLSADPLPARHLSRRSFLLAVRGDPAVGMPASVGLRKAATAADRLETAAIGANAVPPESRKRQLVQYASATADAAGHESEFALARLSEAAGASVERNGHAPTGERARGLRLRPCHRRR